jgi:replicative DNA helicase
MSAEQLMIRALSSLLKVSYKTIYSEPHTLSDQHWNLLSKSIGKLSQYPMHIDDSASLSISQLEARAHKHYAEHGHIDLITVDYLQLMKGMKGTVNPVEVLSEVSRGLKVLAKDLHTVVMALAQVNRQVEYRSIKRPTLADLRGSGTMEQDADIVTFLYRDEVYDPDTPRPNICEADVAKNRNSTTGVADLYFNGANMLLRNLQRAEVEF